MRLAKAVWFWLQVSGAVVATLAVCWLTAQYAFHLKLLNVQTGSMRPTFNPGDALIMRQVSTTDLRIGMIASYHSTRNPNELVTHRVVGIFPEKQSFQTKGDRLSVPDPTVQDGLLVGRVVAVLPSMGRSLNWLRSWPGLVVCVYIPAALIGVGELYRLERVYVAQRIYHLPEKQVVS